MHKWTNPHLRHLVESDVNSLDQDVDDAFARAGQTLKRERTRQRVTQKQLADRTGVPQGQISRVENGKERASLETLVRLANGLGRRISVVLEQDDRNG